jgi:hypothetical protein
MSPRHTLGTSLAFLFRHAIYAQGIYYLLGGVWPFISMTAFQTVTGPKTDLWLVKTVALLLIVIAAALISAAYKLRLDLPVAILGMGTAFVLVVVELVYTSAGTISPIYLLDTVVELFFFAGWIRHYVLAGFRESKGLDI